MGKNLFSVPIFFIVFRETIEGALILAILLGLAHQISYNTRGTLTTGPGDYNTESVNTSRDESKATGRLGRILKIQAS
jgi:high-affinity iron transporter